MKVKGTSLERTEVGTIINKDSQGREKYKRAREHRRQEAEKASSLQNQVDALTAKMDRIEGLLLKLVEE